MTTDRNRVAVFVVVGVLMAGLVGVLVWWSGAPTDPSASDTATTSRLLSTSDAGSPPDSPAPAPVTDGDDASALTAPALGDANVTLPEPNDPFLAPNAVVAAPQRETPTTVYRPDNIGARITETDTADTTADRDEPSSGPAQAIPRPTTPVAPETTAGADTDASVPEAVPSEPPAPEPGEPAPAGPPAPDTTAPEPAPASPAPEGPQPGLDATDETEVDSPAAGTTAPLEPVEPTPTPIPDTGTGTAPAGTPAPAPEGQDVPAETPDSGTPGSGYPWSWSTVRTWLPW